MRKPLNKTIRILLYIIGAVLLLLLSMAITTWISQCARTANTPPQPVTEAPTETPEPTPMPDRFYDGLHNPAFEPDAAKLGISEDEIESYDEDVFLPQYWMDMTPADMDESAGCTVIRHMGLGYSYVIYEGNYYRLGEGDDGKGLLDIILSDLNGDEKPDLLYTYHFGAGTDAQTKVGWFDLETCMEKTSAFGIREGFAMLSAEEGSYALYRCERIVDEQFSVTLQYGDRLGEIVEQMDALYLLLD